MTIAKKIPIWIQDFARLRKEGYVYVDKTDEILQMVNANPYYFLPRPRRFWKSLLCSTMKYLFLGERELFEGLYAEKNWDWEQWYPVIYISFAWWWSKDTIGKYVKKNGRVYWREWGEIKEAKAEEFWDFKEKIQYLVEKVYARFDRKVVILIDEYDRPVLNILHKPDEAEELREKFRDFYAGIKDIDKLVRLFFLTWITKILKMSIFSVLNNLQDLFYDPIAYKIVGYSQQELLESFGQQIEEFAAKEGVSKEELLRLLKDFYNGYNFGNPEDRIYNPWDINNAMEKKMFWMYWSQTWLPSAVEEYIRQRQVDVKHIMEKVYAWELVVNEVDLNLENLRTISAEVLFLTSGYLTVKQKRFDELYCEFPNKQVEKVVSSYFAKLQFGVYKATELQSISRRFVEALKKEDKEGIKEALENLLEWLVDASYERWKRNPEWWLKTLILLLLNLTIDFAIGEKHTVVNRPDIFVIVNGKKYVLEVKVNWSQAEVEEAIKKYQGKADKVIVINWIVKNGGWEVKVYF